MKKSTIITTIAMIVVVVVALSTATYAWFTTQQNTVVEMSVTTHSEAGWALTANTTAIGTNEHTYQTIAEGASSKAMNFSGTSGISSLNSGLWCPTGTVAATITTDTNDCSYTPGVAFFSAFQTTEADNTEIKVSAAPAYYQGEVVRIANANSEGKTAKLTITISFANADNSPTSTVLSSAIAAAGLRFVVIDSEGTVVANTAYYKINTAAASSAAAIGGPNSMVATEGSNFYTASYTLVPDNSGFTQPASQDLSEAANIEAGNAASGGFLFTSSALTNYGVDANSFYAQYSFVTPSIKAGAGKNYVIYYWLDGALLSSSAGLAGLSLHFSVGDAT